jgi:hypothetical protein
VLKEFWAQLVGAEWLVQSVRRKAFDARHSTQGIRRNGATKFLSEPRQCFGNEESLTVMVREKKIPKGQEVNQGADHTDQQSHLQQWMRQSLGSAKADLSQLIHRVQVGDAQQIREHRVQTAGASTSGSSGNAPISSPPSARTTTLPSPRAGVEAPPETVDPQAKNRRWQLICLLVFGLFGCMGTASLVWLTSLPPQPECQQSNRMSTDAELLYCAQLAAESGELPKLVANIDLLNQWGPDHELYREARRLIDKWSARVLSIAQTKLDNDDFKGALGAIRHIPKTSSVYEDAQDTVRRWQQHWRKGAEIYAKAQTAMRQQRWDDASQHILQLTKFDLEYWSDKRASELAQQLGVERQARQTLTQAQKLARSGKPEEVGAAIVAAQRVPNGTFASAEAVTSLKIWSQQLLAQGQRKWEEGNRKAAIAMLKLPPIPNAIPEVKDLDRFGQAYNLIDTSQSTWLPTLGQVWNTMEAISAVEQVKADSQFHETAQGYIKDWKVQLKDLVQLQYASLTASLGPHSALQLAVEQAKLISPGHPRRLQAQTLVAYWNQEVESLEDRPLIARAREMAKSGKIDDLRFAMTEAGRVSSGRKLRGEAQDLIFTWQSQIEVIEDQPILNRAYALAEEGKLNEAIDVAAKIGGDRALYAEAQSSIATWDAILIRQIQIAQDQPLLDRAYALADQGNLSGAIDVASQVGYGRALSGEAQGAIDQWATQLRPPEPIVEAAPASDPTAEDPSSTAEPPVYSEHYQQQQPSGSESTLELAPSGDYGSEGYVPQIDQSPERIEDLQPIAPAEPEPTLPVPSVSEPIDTAPPPEPISQPPMPEPQAESPKTNDYLRKVNNDAMGN